MIDENHLVPDIEKFEYLRFPLKHESSRIFSHSDYNVAWLFVKTFQNTRFILFNHVSVIFDQRSVREESHTDFRNTPGNLYHFS